MSSYDEFLDMYNDAFNDCELLSEESAAVPQEDQEEYSEESAEVLEEDLEEVSHQEALRYVNTAESTVEITGEVQVINFDSWDTPLNSCSAVTISVLLILFFLALASIGGVLND